MGKSNTYITGPRSKPLLSPPKEAAKHLANAARRFVEDKANAADIEVAVNEWRRALLLHGNA